MKLISILLALTLTGCSAAYQIGSPKPEVSKEELAAIFQKIEARFQRIEAFLSPKEKLSKIKK